MSPLPAMPPTSPLPTHIPTDGAAQVIILPATPPQDPPPPYPSRERRRAGRSGRRRRTIAGGDTDHLQLPSTGTESEFDSSSPTTLSPFPSLDLEDSVTETTPLLPSPRLPSGGIARRHRARTLSISSTLHSVTSVAPSFAQTVISAFHPDRDCDLDPDEPHTSDLDEHDLLDSPASHDHLPDEQPPTPRIGRRAHASVSASSAGGRWRRYLKPLTRRAYYSALFHLLVLNFPYALAAWVYLFVFTLTGTTTLMALPLGALLCFLNLLGARAFARGELWLQTTYHGPLAFPAPYPAHPLFTRMHIPTAAELEDGIGPSQERSFYRNAYAMFTDPTSYQALFYFLVIKPGVTVFLSLLLVVVVPVGFGLVLPAPAVLRLVRRLGIWQANIAVEGLYYAVR